MLHHWQNIDPAKYVQIVMLSIYKEEHMDSDRENKQVLLYILVEKHCSSDCGMLESSLKKSNLKCNNKVLTYNRLYLLS